MGAVRATIAMPNMVLGAVWESTWLQSIFDQDPLTGHPPLLQGDTPINNWTRENNPAKSKTPLFN